MADDAPTFVRDLEREDRLQQIIYNNAAGPNSDGEYSDREDSSDEEDVEEFSAKCLNDSGDGLELENFRDDDDEEEPSGSLAKQKVYILSLVDHYS